MYLRHLQTKLSAADTAAGFSVAARWCGSNRSPHPARRRSQLLRPETVALRSHQLALLPIFQVSLILPPALIVQLLVPAFVMVN